MKTCYLCHYMILPMYSFLLRNTTMAIGLIYRVVEFGEFEANINVSTFIFFLPSTFFFFFFSFCKDEMGFTCVKWYMFTYISRYVLPINILCYYCLNHILPLIIFFLFSKISYGDRILLTLYVLQALSFLLSTKIASAKLLIIKCYY